MIRFVRVAAFSLLVFVFFPVSLVSAQMPDLRTMSGKPLPVADLAVGTVTIRVAKQMPSNPAAGVELKATVTVTGKAPATKTATTGADGRATFSDLPAGALFQAATTVDGEPLQTDPFPVPAAGGIRVMIIAGLGGAPAQATDPHGTPTEAADANSFRMGAITGTVATATDLPKGSLELTVRDGKGAPVADTTVRLGQVKDDKVQVREAKTDAQGVARFSGLPGDDGSAFAAVVEYEGVRLATEGFRSADTGLRGEIKALRRTTDTSNLRIDDRSRTVIETREEAIVIMQRFVFKNIGEEIVEPGPTGLLIPAAAGHKSLQDIPGGSPAEIRGGVGMAITRTIAPNSAASSATAVQFGYVLGSEGAPEITLRQSLPFGLESPFFIVPVAGKLTLSAPGIKKLESKTDEKGNAVDLYEMPEIKPGGELVLTVSGLAAHDRSGARIAGIVVLALIALGLVTARPTGDKASAKRKDPENDRVRAKLLADREATFTDLVVVEKQRRALAGTDAELDRQRAQLVARLETVYRDLHEPRSP